MKGTETVQDRPNLATEWDYGKNSALSPDQVPLYSGKNVWWKCAHGHSWEATPANRCHGTGCPYCANKKVLAGYNDLQSRSPDLAASWDYKKTVI